MAVKLRNILLENKTKEGNYLIDDSLMNKLLKVISDLEYEKQSYYEMLSETQRWQLRK